jgi:preprotein translocase subunit SecG
MVNYYLSGREDMLENILLVVSVLIIAIVLLQSNKASDAGQIITGGNETLFQNMKERGVELFISRLTLVLGVAFFVISLVLFLM